MATASARVKVDRSAVSAFLREPEQTRLLGIVADEIADTAKTVAPDRSGYYKKHMGTRRFRDWYRVENTDPFAHLVEWGSKNNPAYAPIRTAIREVGVRVEFGPAPH